jgi:Dynamin GTPase effector domain
MGNGLDDLDTSGAPSAPSGDTGLAVCLDGRRVAEVIADGPEEDMHLRTIGAHVSAYITHVRRQIRHTIPKAIVHCLVRRRSLPPPADPKSKEPPPRGAWRVLHACSFHLVTPSVAFRTRALCLAPSAFGYESRELVLVCTKAILESV